MPVDAPSDMTVFVPSMYAPDAVALWKLSCIECTALSFAVAVGTDDVEYMKMALVALLNPQAKLLPELNTD